MAQSAPQHAHVQGGGRAGTMGRAQNPEAVDQPGGALAWIAGAVRFRYSGCAARGQRQVAAPSGSVPFHETHTG